MKNNAMIPPRCDEERKRRVAGKQTDIWAERFRSHAMFSAITPIASAANISLIEHAGDDVSVFTDEQIRDLYVEVAGKANWWQLSNIDGTDAYMPPKPSQAVGEGLHRLKGNMNLWPTGSFLCFW